VKGVADMSTGKVVCEWRWRSVVRWWFQWWETEREKRCIPEYICSGRGLQ
jgi:hypothetical protein